MTTQFILHLLMLSENASRRKMAARNPSAIFLRLPVRDGDSAVSPDSFTRRAAGDIPAVVRAGAPARFS